MDLKLIKQKINTINSKGSKQPREKVDYTKIYWKPKPGKHVVRIVPSKFDKNNPFKEVFFHYGFAKYPILALTNWGEKDPIVEFASQLRKTKDKDNWVLAKKIDPKMRVFVPVVVRGEEHMGTRLWEFGKEIYMQLLGLADDEDYGDYTDIVEGRDFTIEAVSAEVAGRMGVKCNVRIKPKTSVVTEDKDLLEKILNEQPNILEINRKHSFDDLKATLEKWLDPESETSEDTTEVKVAASKPKSDLPFDNEDEEEEEVSTSKKSSYTLTNNATKKSKADRFDELFNED